jgi:hypothetical protein
VSLVEVAAILRGGAGCKAGRGKFLNAEGAKVTQKAQKGGKRRKFKYGREVRERTAKKDKKISL